MVEQVMSGPIDPHALLEDINTMLGEEGSIKSLEEVDRIVSLMQEAQKMVSRCIYLNVVKSTTDEEILKKFISVGGWDILNTWLQEAKSENNIPLLTEVLKVYSHMPVSLELLKQNNCAKTIKHLMRLEDEDIKNLSSEIVDSWMKTIKNKNDCSSEKPKKKGKKRHQKSSPPADGDPVKVADISESTENNGDSSPNNNSNDSCDRTADDSKETSSSNTSIVTVSKRKTAKTAPSKFRSTGLEVESKLTPTSKKKLAMTSKEKLPLKKVSVVKSTPVVGEKRPRSNLETVSTSSSGHSSLSVQTSPTETPGRIKLISPKRLPVSDLYDSSSFIDALTNQAASAHAVRKKRRISNEKLAAAAKASSKGSTSPDEKTPVVMSFYKETLKCSDDNNQQGEEGTSPSHEAESAVDNENEVSQDVDMKDDSRSETRDDDSEKTEDTGSVCSEIPGMVRKKRRKRVHWADDAVIRTVHYFELDETERVNVNRMKDFDEIKREEMLLERHTMQSVRKRSSDNMGEKVLWYRPLPISGLQTLTVPGCNSEEKQRQKERELIVLQALYFTKDMIPDTPKEPDPESYEPMEPKKMPLEDVTGESGEVTHLSYPPPVTSSLDMIQSSTVNKAVSLPEDITKMLASLAQTANGGSSQHSGQSMDSMGGFSPNMGNEEAGGLALPPELRQMLAALTQMNAEGLSPGDNNDANTRGSPLPANVDIFLNQLKVGGKYADSTVDHLKHMLTMMPQSVSGLPRRGFGNSNNSAPLLGIAPPGHMPPGPGHGPGPGMRMPMRFPGDRPIRPGDEWNENMRGGPRMPGRGPSGIPQWQGPGGMMPPGPPRMVGPPRLGPMRPHGPHGPPPGMMMRGPGPRGRGRGGPVLCKFFSSPTGCHAGPSCRFLHPGVNGPPL